MSRVGGGDFVEFRKKSAKFWDFFAFYCGLTRFVTVQGLTRWRGLLFFRIGQGRVFYAALNDCHQHYCDREPAQVVCKAGKKVVDTVKEHCHHKEGSVAGCISVY